LKCSVNTPNNSDYYNYFCNLFMEIPYEMPCTIKSPNKGVSAYSLDTTLYVLNSSGEIDVARHNGSCDLKTSFGDILVEISIPENGYCHCKTASGNIKVMIPTTSSASILAKTSNGKITFTNLDIKISEEYPGFLSGSIGSGKGSIYLETDDGNIEIIGFN